MRATAQEEQLRAGLFDIARLVEPPIVDGEDLIATDDNCTRMPARDNLSFFLCERLRGRDRITARTPRRRLDPRLVDKSGGALEAQARCPQERGAGSARRCQDQAIRHLRALPAP